jgi:hypothetical protein
VRPRARQETPPSAVQIMEPQAEFIRVHTRSLAEQANNP